MIDKRERGTGRIFQRGNIWWIQYYFHGQQIRVSTGEADEKKARKNLRVKLAEVQTGTHADCRNIRYDGLRGAYLADYMVNKRKSLRRDREGNPRLDAVVRLDDFFTGFRANEIDSEVIRKFIAYQPGKGLSNGSINRSISALRREKDFWSRRSIRNSRRHCRIISACRWRSVSIPVCDLAKSSRFAGNKLICSRTQSRCGQAKRKTTRAA